jgi:hypothetical protein
MNTFENDLKVGQRAEEYVLEQLKSEHPGLKRVYGMSLHSDLEDEDGYTVEVKYDIRSKDTGNVGIEYRHRGVLSAISVSKATEWVLVYFLNGVGWVYTKVKTNDLRAFLRNNWKYFKKFKGSGDKSDLVLVATTLLAENFPYNKILHIVDRA